MRYVMKEHQTIEYKQIWRDDYLKWVCGFANAKGGIVYIGKNDNGKVVGIRDYKKLMEDLPNKIHDLLGIMAEINLRKKKSLYFIEIIVPTYSVPISYRGRYYYRSGSTKKELTGSSLNEFLLKKSGKSWDEVVETRAKLSDIDKKSVEIYLKSAVQAKRFPANEKLSLKNLLIKLQLLEKGKLKRAALVLFGKEPMRFFPSMYARIGRFGESKVDLRFQESIEGNLIYCLQEVLNQLDRKFLISPVSFDGIHRLEKWQYPLPALREILLNALIHKNYMGAHIQIEVHDDRLCFWNDGKLPEDLPIKLLKKNHSSKPRNPIIADVCFKGGYIDAWGRGIKKIMDACKEERLPEPEFEENSGGIMVTLFAAHSRIKKSATPQVTPQVKKLLNALTGEMTRAKLMKAAKLKDRVSFLRNYLEPALKNAFIEMTQP
ncbi:MAG: putative DNA binding domain-containing protein, partial [Elusimicrobiales bacterium]|nr:putative DNA binding domain-containing protein [Elusimicrobiales bacterium]